MTQPKSGRPQVADIVRVRALIAGARPTDRRRGHGWDEQSATELWELLRRRVGSSVAKRVGYGTDPDEVAALLWTRIVGDLAYRAKFVEDSDAFEKPFEFLFGTAVRHLRDPVAAGAARLDDGPEETISGLPTMSGWSSDNRPSLSDAVTATLHVLLPHTPVELHGAVTRLVGWLAVSPPQKASWDTEDINHAAVLYPALSRDQVAAIASLCWGARPNRRDTSLFWRHLKPVTESRLAGESDEEHLDRVRPMSNTLRRALCDYRVTIRRPAHQHRLAA